MRKALPRQRPKRGTFSLLKFLNGAELGHELSISLALQWLKEITAIRYTVSVPKTFFINERKLVIRSLSEVELINESSTESTHIGHYVCVTALAVSSLILPPHYKETYKR